MGRFPGAVVLFFMFLTILGGCAMSNYGRLESHQLFLFHFLLDKFQLEFIRLKTIDYNQDEIYD